MTLAQRMAAITKALDSVAKSAISKEKDGKKWTEKGHIVEVILSEVRPLLDKHEIDLRPALVERTYTGNRCDVIIDFTFESLVAPHEREVMRWGGAGTDNGDKAFAKAGTNALKEMLKKRFLITDRDDAKEEDERVEHQTGDAIAQRDLVKAQEQRRAAIGQWAKTFKAALEGAKEAADVDRLKRENRDQLDSEDLPEVTRQFFNELIAERKAELS